MGATTWYDPFRSTVFILPNQAYQAMQPRIEDTITRTLPRQYNSFAEQAGIFDQFGGGWGRGDDDDHSTVRSVAPRVGGRIHGSDANAIVAWGRRCTTAASGRQLPTDRRGRGANQNVVVRGRRARPGGMPTWVRVEVLWSMDHSTGLNPS